VHASSIISSGQKLLLSSYSIIEINPASRAIRDNDHDNNIGAFMTALANVLEGYDNLQQIPDIIMIKLCY
jgi:hypothetical protein